MDTPPGLLVMAIGDITAEAMMCGGTLPQLSGMDRLRGRLAP